MMSPTFKYAKPWQRICAFWFDFLATISFVAIAGRIFWEFVPGSEVRADAMQLFSEKDFYNFRVTVLFSFIVLTLYNLLTPISKLRGTLGQYVFKICLCEVDGSLLKIKTSLLRLLLIAIKYFLIMSLGPLLASYGENFAASMIAVLLPIAIMLLTSVVAWINPQGVGPIERICGFRYFSK